MLLPAQLYREELKRKMTACWYQPKYKYYFLANYHEIQIGDNADWRRDFVCIYKNEVIGFFSYSYNEVDRSMGNFGLVSFVDNGAILIRDVLKHIKMMFEDGANRLEFWAVADNPANKMYLSLMKRYGGRKVCELRQTNYFGGNYHNSCIYELLSEDYYISKRKERF